MKNLRQFETFDIIRFLDGKILRVVNTSTWYDFEDKEHKNPLGTKVEVVIAEDKTQYAPNKDGDIVDNLFEKMTFKIKKNNLNFPKMAVVSFVNPEAKVYGDFRTELSCTANDVNIVKTKEA